MFFPSNSCNELMAFDHILREANAPPMLVSKVQYKYTKNLGRFASIFLAPAV